mgnify:CR=1 FL=1
MKKLVSVVTPCYNEEEVLPITAPQFLEQMNKMRSEGLVDEDSKILFVNDGSKDRTLDILKAIHKVSDNVKVISFSRNFGKEAAMLAGLKHTSGKYISIMDADLQHTPEMLLLMYNSVGFLKRSFLFNGC